MVGICPVGRQDMWSDWHYRFQPPRVDLEKSNIENSENTALFLVSCFQYIFMGVVLSVGPPFRKPMRSNGKRFWFRSVAWLALTTISAFSAYDIHGPGYYKLHAFGAPEMGVSNYAVDIFIRPFWSLAICPGNWWLLTLLGSRARNLPSSCPSSWKDIFAAAAATP